MQYRVIIPRNVQKDLDTIDSRYKPRIVTALLSLANHPFLGKKLEGEYAGQRSYTVWPYRILYEIRQQELMVFIVRIGHRQGVYG